MKDQPTKDQLQFTWMDHGGRQLLEDLEKENMEEFGYNIYGLTDSEDTDANRSRS